MQSLFYSSMAASILGPLLIILSVRVIRYRRSNRIALGAKDDKQLERRMRAQANFAEYTPLALILLVINELQYPDSWRVITACILLVLGRCIHAWGISQTKENFNFRVAGMLMTFASIIILSIGLVLAGLS
ncbi:MAG: MAPEG family protein [Pseudobacteriovorax sp.]|nr:MAPEG family protein [Pseudobacteriovorax sp.]